MLIELKTRGNGRSIEEVLCLEILISSFWFNIKRNNHIDREGCDVRGNNIGVNFGAQLKNILLETAMWMESFLDSPTTCEVRKGFVKALIEYFRSFSNRGIVKIIGALTCLYFI